MDTETSTKMNWDLNSYFPSFNGPEMDEFKKSLKADVAAIYEKSQKLDTLSEKTFDSWEDVLLKLEDIYKRYSHIRSYIGCLTSVDVNNEDYLKEDANLSVLGSEIEKIGTEILRAFAGASKSDVKKFKKREDLKTASHYIERLYEESKRRMSVEKEILATELGVDGMKSWGRLYNTVSGKLMFDMKFPDGETKKLPMSQRRSYMENPNRELRKAAFFGGNEALKSVEHVATACLNSISGTRLTLNKHRGIDHFLDVALFQSSISRETLESMFEAIYEQIEIPREILRFKAKAMNEKGVAWYDLGAPINLKTETDIGWNDAKSMVHGSFSHFYQGLGEYTNNAFENSWVEWEPREGKRPGGFCTTSLLTKETGVFMTFNGALGDVFTLAHELGHAFHSYLMKDIRPYQRYYPMTLAETASTFGEMILSRGLLESSSIDENEKILMLDSEVDRGAIFLLDIPVRYEFEKALYEERKDGVLSTSRLKELMSETQKKVFGDVLIETDPYFWASKLHFYITGVTFYNFPYTFGYLLSRALFNRFKQEGKSFLKDYEKFLMLSGSDSCENVVKGSIGEDIREKDFWADAIKTLNEPLENLKELLPEEM